jgi:hypothetical protein
MKRSAILSILGACACAVSLLAPVAPASATTVSYQATQVGATTWQYDYTVSNDSLGVDINEFTIFFALGDYANLSVFATPADWDSLVAEPDPNLPDDGWFDSLALVSGIAPGASLGGFSVRFDWLGQGTPGAQSFAVIDPETFAVLGSGRSLSPGSPVPEPGSLALLGLGLIGLGYLRRMNHART